MVFSDFGWCLPPCTFRSVFSGRPVVEWAAVWAGVSVVLCAGFVGDSWSSGRRSSRRWLHAFAWAADSCSVFVRGSVKLNCFPVGIQHVRRRWQSIMNTSFASDPGRGMWRIFYAIDGLRMVLLFF